MPVEFFVGEIHSSRIDDTERAPKVPEGIANLVLVEEGDDVTKPSEGDFARGPVETAEFAAVKTPSKQDGERVPVSGTDFESISYRTHFEMRNRKVFLCFEVKQRSEWISHDFLMGGLPM